LALFAGAVAMVFFFAPVTASERSNFWTVAAKQDPENTALKQYNQ
jgi:hypothetical protein